LEVKPTKGFKVKVSAHREAIFGDESVTINRITIPNDGGGTGILTGVTLAGYCEVDMPTLDGKKHWYPIEDLSGEHGEKIVEEEIQIDEEDEEEGDAEE
jgi:hypothetical protein